MIPYYHSLPKYPIITRYQNTLLSLTTRIPYNHSLLKYPTITHYFTYLAIPCGPWIQARLGCEDTLLSLATKIPYYHSLPKYPIITHYQNILSLTPTTHLAVLCIPCGPWIRARLGCLPLRVCRLVQWVLLVLALLIVRQLPRV